MSIFAHKLVGGNNGADLQGINILNHYIGMREIRAQDFPEMKFIPFALGLFFLLGLRTAVFGRVHQVGGSRWCCSSISACSRLSAFYYRMHTFGHQLSPEAQSRWRHSPRRCSGTSTSPISTSTAIPGAGTYLLGAYALVLSGVLILEMRRGSRANAVERTG